MNTPSNAPPSRMPASDTMYWSIRRELWENRSLTIAPLAVAGFVLFVTMVIAFGLPRRMRTLATLDPAKQHAVLVGPFTMPPSAIMVTVILVGLFYSIDALYGERRDRSILFWKSLPVSDLTTVLSKAAIPLVVLPFIGFALSVAAQLVTLLWSTLILMGTGMSPAAYWGELHLLEMPVTLIYGIGVFALWHAPIYAYLLMVSAWARRAPILWALLPMVVISMVERMVFHTSHFASLQAHRFMGALTLAFNVTRQANGHIGIIDRFDQLNPGRFLTAPGLWIGLLLAAAFLAAAVRLRRNREPL